MTGVIENFDAAAKVYEQQATAQTALAAALAGLISSDERQGRALEFGAGTGLLTRQLQPWKGIYTATDAAPQMVRMGRELCPAVAWKTLDARTPQSEKPADWLLACNLLQWLEEPEAVLREWKKIVAPGGQFLVAVQIEGTLTELEQVLTDSSPLRWREPTGWQTLFERAGFVITHHETWNHTTLHPNAHELLRTIHAMGLAPRRSVGPGRLRTALTKYDRLFAVKGGVRASWSAWLARGRAG